MVSQESQSGEKTSTIDVAKPDWTHRVWLASFNSDANPDFGPNIKRDSLISWSIEPHSVSEFLELQGDHDIVAFEARSVENPDGKIIAVGRMLPFEANTEEKPQIQISVVDTFFDRSINYNHNSDNVIDPKFTTELLRLSSLDSERFGSYLKEHVEPTRAYRVTNTPDARPTSDAASKQTAPKTKEDMSSTDDKPIQPPLRELEDSVKPDPNPDPTPPKTLETQSRFSTDEPRSVVDTLRRAPNAFVVAQYLDRLRGAPVKDVKSQDSYVLHVDAPWGGGKTTFANFIENFLSFNHHKTRKNVVTFIKDSGVDQSLYEPLAENDWMILHFNAWENQHVSPPWWNFYTSFLNGYKDKIEHPTGLQINEWHWRIWTPETKKSLLITAALVVVATLLAMNTIKEGQLEPLTAAASLLGAGSLLAFIFAQAKAGIKRVVDASNSAYNPTVLGETDPLTRLGDRFLEVSKWHDRPVLMVIDDIDRCEPEYVVELMRGLITIFQSNHVSYLILGDRGWIEQSFENVNDDMSKAHTDETVSFGARFAEKVIQMSYLLPEIPEEQRKLYLRSVLGLNEDQTQEIEQVQRTIRQKFANAKTPEEKDQVKKEIQAIEPKTDIEAKTTRDELNIQSALANASAADQLDKIRHGLEEVWFLLPENPRRVKRLVNMIAVYQASAESTLGLDPKNAKDWFEMVLWLILFSEFPNVFAAIYARPSLLDPLPKPNAEKLLFDWKIKGGLPRLARAVIDGVTIEGTLISITPDVATKMRKLTPLG